MVVTPAAARRVLHVVPPGGGGVDRCVRDIVRHRPGDAIVHVGDAQCVLEIPARARFVPLAADDLVRWAGEGGLGAPLVLHAHSTVAAVRQLCGRLQQATAAPRLLTLHDIWFADPALGADEVEQRLGFVRSAERRCAPSLYIVERARDVLGDGVPVQHLPLGAEPFDPTEALATPIGDAAEHARGEAGFAVAVIGAIGAHKGLAALEALAPRLPPEARVVVLGYTERQLRQGWTAGGRIWVHGIFHPAQLPRLVQHYGARLALFPPGMPESHCYALSDAWMSGLTVLAPDHGALGERVRRHGGGRLYDPAIDTDGLVAAVMAALAQARRHEGGVPLQAPLPTMEDTMTPLNALYAGLPDSGPPRPADDDGVQRLAQKHLDGHFFRLEVTDLQREVETAWRAHDALRQQLAEQQAALAAMQQERDAALAAYQGLRGRLQRLIGWLPAPLQRALVALGRRGLR